MVKTAKITLSLPKPVLTWLQESATQRYVSSNEYLRALIVDLYVASQGIHARSSGSPEAAPSPKSTGHNNANFHKTRSGFKGVYPYGRRWAAVISYGGKQERIAVCDTPEEAARAYDQALVERAGGDPRAAVNAVTEKGRAALLVDQPFIEKLARGEHLTDVEMASWKRQTGTVPPAPSTLPVTMTTPSASEPMVPPVRRQLRRSSGAIDRPPDPDVDDGA
jgi:hypothetical protein